MDRIELSYVTISYSAPIVYLRYEKDVELGFPEIRQLIACAEKISGHQPYVTFSDVSNVNISVTPEGKRVLSDPDNSMPLFRGTAALVKNNMYKFAAEFLNVFNKPKYPFRAFTSEEEAISWLSALPLDK